MSRRPTKIALAIGFTVSLSAAQVLAWTYNVGPNYVNMSATSCHSRTAAAEARLLRSVGEVKVTGGGQVLYCPINRRGTMYYQTYKNSPSTGNRPYYVDIQRIAVRAADTNASEFLYCWAWGTNKDTGSTTFGASRTLCSTPGGCDAGSTSYTGQNSMSLTFPFPTIPTVSYGYACSVGNDSRLHYAEASITPNP